MSSDTHRHAAFRPAGGALPRALAAIGITALAWGVAAALIAAALQTWSAGPAAQWTVARAAGITGYVLLVALVAAGLWLAGPRRSGLGAAHSATILRIHIALASATLAFIVLHVIVLIADSHAGVGLRGALVPLGSSYRPVPVTLGVLGCYAGLAAGLTARFAPWLGRRVWLRVHRVAIVAFLLVWAHGVTAGTDTRELLALHVGSGAGLLCLAAFRYTGSTPSDHAGRRAVGAWVKAEHPLGRDIPASPRPVPEVGARVKAEHPLGPGPSPSEPEVGRDR